MPVDKVLTVTSEIVSHPTNLHNLHTVLTFIILVSSRLFSSLSLSSVLIWCSHSRDVVVIWTQGRERMKHKHNWAHQSFMSPSFSTTATVCFESPDPECNEFIVSVSRKYGDKLRSCCSLKWRILSQQATSVRCKTVAFQKHILPRRRRRNRKHRDRRYSNYSSESLSLFVTCPRRYHLNNTAMFKR